MNNLSALGCSAGRLPSDTVFQVLKYAQHMLVLTMTAVYSLLEWNCFDGTC